MGWSLRWTDQAIRDLTSLDPPVARRVVAKLDQAAEHPEHFFRRLAGAADYKLRVGDYRVLAALDHETRTILVERVGHRSGVYDR
jgi:mRNA interferase RelE/StbE